MRKIIDILKKVVGFIMLVLMIILIVHNNIPPKMIGRESAKVVNKEIRKREGEYSSDYELTYIVGFDGKHKGNDHVTEYGYSKLEIGQDIIIDIYKKGLFTERRIKGAYYLDDTYKEAQRVYFEEHGNDE